MEKAIIGKKVGMTQIFDADGKVIPVTVIEAGPCTVVQKKTAEKDGYNAVQLGYGDVPEKKLTKPELGHLKKAGDARKKYLKEFKLSNSAALNVGDEQVTVLNLDVVKVDNELGIIAVRGAIPGPKGGIVYVRNSVINVKEKGTAAGISSNPQKASARVNPQKASARNK